MLSNKLDFPLDSENPFVLFDVLNSDSVGFMYFRLSIARAAPNVTFSFDPSAEGLLAPLAKTQVRIGLSSRDRDLCAIHQASTELHPLIHMQQGLKLDQQLAQSTELPAKYLRSLEFKTVYSKPIAFTISLPRMISHHPTHEMDLIEVMDSREQRCFVCRRSLIGEAWKCMQCDKALVCLSCLAHDNNIYVVESLLRLQLVSKRATKAKTKLQRLECDQFKANDFSNFDSEYFHIKPLGSKDFTQSNRCFLCNVDLPERYGKRNLAKHRNGEEHKKNFAQYIVPWNDRYWRELKRVWARIQFDTAQVIDNISFEFIRMMMVFMVKNKEFATFCFRFTSEGVLWTRRQLSSLPKIAAKMHEFDPVFQAMEAWDVRVSGKDFMTAFLDALFFYLDPQHGHLILSLIQDYL